MTTLTTMGPTRSGDDNARPGSVVRARPKWRNWRLGRGRSAERRGAALLVAPYLIVMLAAGMIPAGYAIYESFTNPNSGQFAGLSNYHTVIDDFRFWPAFEHVGLLIVIWIPMMVVGVVGLALLIDATRGRFGNVMLFVFYIPGALSGMANFMLWLLLLDPTVSPIKFLLRAAGAHTLDDVLTTAPDVAVVLAAMLFFQGAGSWLLIVYGGLNTISEEVIEASRLDGCGHWRAALYVKLPIIRPWIAYLALVNFAYAFQVFLEPQLLSQAAHGLVSPTWSPNQLSYTYAFEIGNIPGAAALSVIILVVTLVLGIVIVSKTGLFEKD
jgi:multiple sugar transport system permease protein